MTKKKKGANAVDTTKAQPIPSPKHSKAKEVIMNSDPFMKDEEVIKK